MWVLITYKFHTLHIIKIKGYKDYQGTYIFLRKMNLLHPTACTITRLWKNVQVKNIWPSFAIKLQER